MTRLSSIDPEDLERELRRLDARSRWLRPLVYSLGALLGLFGAVATLLRNWRLVLLEIIPAVWIGAITWQWRRIVLFGDPLPAVHGLDALLVIVGVLAATVVAYWCNATFAFTVGQSEPISISAAYAHARTRAPVIWVAALGTAALHAATSIWVVQTTIVWYALALGAVAIVQMYALVAVPVSLIGSQRTRGAPLNERVRRATASAGLSGVAATPGLVLNRTAVLLIGLGWLRWVGFMVLAASVVMQIAAVSSATAVKLVTRLDATTPDTAITQPRITRPG